MKRYTPVKLTKQTRNRPQTDKNQCRAEIGLQSVFDSVLSVWCRIMFGQTNLTGDIFLTCLKDLSRQIVSCLLVLYLCGVGGCVRGRVGLNSATNGRLSVGLIDRLCFGYLSADLTPIQDRIKSDITPNCVESAYDSQIKTDECPISRTWTECKPITVCGVIHTYNISLH